MRKGKVAVDMMGKEVIDVGGASESGADAHVVRGGSRAWANEIMHVDESGLVQMREDAGAGGVRWLWEALERGSIVDGQMV